MRTAGRKWIEGVLVVTIASLVAPAAAVAQDKPADDDGIRFFETRIRPVLADHCYACHGEDAQEGELRLDSYAALLKGSQSGPVVVAKHPEESLLWVAISHRNEELQMPPDEKLTDQQIADLAEWIRRGLPHPEATAQPIRPQTSIDLAEGRKFWSFQPLADVEPPEVQRAQWCRTPIDHFILKSLEDKGLAPAEESDRRTWLRRVNFNLTGLPPTPAEVDAFVSDTAPGAHERVVDRLLSTPEYGQRWARHWLDVARYADSNGLDENIAHGNAWRYRDYVVECFNGDKPYDVFVKEQIAGDLLPATDELSAQNGRLIATGFLSLGPKVLAEPDKVKMEMDIIDEQIDTTGRAFMGLTLGCARCHDHKFDPISTADYYALAGIFKSTRTMESLKTIAKWWEVKVPTAADKERQAAYEAEVAAQKSQIEQLVASANQALVQSKESGFELPKKPEGLYPAQTREQLASLRKSLETLEKNPPEMPAAMGVEDREVIDVCIHVRGSHLTQGREVPRRLPEVLAGEDQPSFPDDHSGRLRLAEWMAGDGHPLTARVMVNRIWQWHFGQGLVATVDNFGRLGEKPTHPELLDWLAARFVADGWSIKRLHKLILLSSTYRMSSTFDARAAEADPENRLLWHFPVRRLDAESIRDALLAVTGGLDTTMGGSLLHVKNREFFFNHTSQDTTSYDSPRRSLYLPIVRNNLYDVFQLFDYTDASVSQGQRAVSTVAPQALFLLNGPLMVDSAQRWADRVCAESSDLETRVTAIYWQAYGRSPSEDEIEAARAYVSGSGAQPVGDAPSAEPRRAWGLYCQAILASSEFLFVR